MVSTTALQCSGDPNIKKCHRLNSSITVNVTYWALLNSKKRQHSLHFIVYLWQVRLNAIFITSEKVLTEPLVLGCDNALLLFKELHFKFSPHNFFMAVNASNSTNNCSVFSVHLHTLRKYSDTKLLLCSLYPNLISLISKLSLEYKVIVKHHLNNLITHLKLRMLSIVSFGTAVGTFGALRRALKCFRFLECFRRCC